jgi:hypothetical protein
VKTSIRGDNRASGNSTEDAEVIMEAGVTLASTYCYQGSDKTNSQTYDDDTEISLPD